MQTRDSLMPKNARFFLPNFSSTLCLAHRLAALTIFLAVTLSGCGGGGGGGNHAESMDENTQRKISGHATKGVLKQAKVDFYRIESGIFDTLLSSTFTDNEGHFEVLLPSGETGPVGIEISHAGGIRSLMVCDASIGCGSSNQESELDTNQNGLIDFGESFNLPQNFVLRAVTSLDKLDNEVHVTPLTHIATAYAEHFPLGIHPDSIEIANAQVAEIFGLERPIDEIKAIDLTDTSAVSSASTEMLNYALYNASFLEIYTPDELMGGLSLLATSFAEAQGQLKWNSDEDREVTLSTLAENAANTANFLSLEASQVAALSLANQAKIAPIDSYTNASVYAQDTQGLVNTKNLIANIKSWNDEFQIEGDSGEFFNAWQHTLEKDVAPRWNKILAPLTLAAQFGVLSALPDLALQAVCNSFNNSAATVLCNLILDTDNLHLVCREQSRSIQFFRQNFCDIIAEVTLIKAKDLTVTYYFFEERISIIGTLDQIVEANLEFVAIPNTANKFGFLINGWISDNQSRIEFESSEATLSFQSDVTLFELNLPNELHLNFKGLLQTLDLENNINIAGDLDFDLDLTGLRNDILALDRPNLKTVIATIKEQLDAGKGYSGASTFIGNFSDENGRDFDLDISVSYGEDTNFFNTNLTWLSATGQRSTALSGEIRSNTSKVIQLVPNKLTLNSLISNLTITSIAGGGLTITSDNHTTLSLYRNIDGPDTGVIASNQLNQALIEKEENWIYINYADGTTDDLYFGHLLSF